MRVPGKCTLNLFHLDSVCLSLEISPLFQSVGLFLAKYHSISPDFLFLVNLIGVSIAIWTFVGHSSSFPF